VVDSPAVAAGAFAAFPDQVDAQRKLDPNLDHESPLHELFADQLASADLVILNKTDLINPADLARVRLEVAEELPPAVKIIEASSGRLPLDVLIGLGAGSEEHIDSRHSHHDHHHDGDDDHDDHDHDAFDSISIELPQADESLLLDALTQLVVQHGILRVKVLRRPEQPDALADPGRGQRFDKHFDRQWGAEEARVTRLVLIGQELDATVLEAQLRAALSV
jgi:cobalamin biosynthesis protein CobW